MTLPLNHGPQGKHGPNWDAEPGLDVIALLADRRQRAREAGQDVEAANFDDPQSGVHAMDVAIETATRVRITHEIILAFVEAPDPPESDPDDIAEPLRAAFRAAGFEVEE